MARKLKILAFLGGVALLMTLGWFWFVCRDYSTEAFRGPKLPLNAANEAIVVLAGDSNRISAGFKLVRERGSLVLLLSGVESGVSLVEIVNQQGSSAVNIHETWEKVILESDSTTTVENAMESLSHLTTKKVSSILLVTSDYHMPRAKMIFEKFLPNMKITAYPVPSEFSILTISGIRRFFLEYWKYLLFHVGIRS